IFYIAPFTSILEQNAAELRRYTGHQEDILEHHSNVIFDESDEDDEKYREYNALTENWESSALVATTAVQLLNTLFSDSTRCVRRLASLVRSVIIIDELQALPIKTYKLFSGAISCLSELFGCTVILCSATQPLFDLNDSWRLSGVKPIIADESRYFETFRRCSIKPFLKNGGYDINEAARFVYDKAISSPSLLCIVNTKKAAREICEYLTGRFEEAGESPLIVHLSTNMYPMHRSDRIAELKTALKAIEEHPESARRVVCISTQLIEAGVDLSFRQVIRSSAGLDSIIQAAGRCNREGMDAGGGSVWVININEKLPDSLKPAREAGEYVIISNGGNSGADGAVLLTKAAMDCYYAKYMSMINKDMSYMLPKLNTSICTLLSENVKMQQSFAGESEKFFIRQAYKTACSQFHAIDDAGIDVIVECEHSRGDILLLGSDAAPKQKRAALRRLQLFSVSLNFGMQQKLAEVVVKSDTGKKSGHVYILPECYYNKVYGVSGEKESEMKNCVY
ncbi:MAG: CRISPR-associated helicase/endonuclease Cas3, partial [Eubacteriales bacterium]